jgi:alpha-galactosidase
MEMIHTAFSMKPLLAHIRNPFVQAMQDGPGFSCQADEINLGEFPAQIVLKSQDESTVGNHCRHRVIFAHPPSGLEAEIDYHYFMDTQALEIEGRLHNRGQQVITNMSGPFSLKLDFDLQAIGTPRMTSVYGGAPTAGYFPPPAYQVTETDGMRSLIGGRESGRSTEGVAPYAIVTDPAAQYGFFVAYEWPCRWILCAGASGKLLAHVSYTGFDLAPGESVCLPKALIGFFDGDAVAGSNALRRHVVKHVLRPIPDVPALPPVFYNTYWAASDGTGIDDIAYLQQEAEVYAELGIEYFVIDAGWFKDGFRSGIGNWEIEETRMFPEGMAAFADYVRALGMKFGAWLEYEFAMKTSDWVQRHPDWFHYADGKHNYFYGTRAFDDCLLRLDDPGVRAQVLEFLLQWVERYGIEWVRIDFNNTPAPFWEANEADNQWGRIQLEYGEGMLALLDAFMQRCPQVQIEACAGGGYRMDLGTLRRAHSLWMNDNSNDVHAIRRFKAGINRILPGCYGNSCFNWATHEDRCPQSRASLQANGYPPVALRSHMAGSLGFAERTALFTPEIKAYLKQEIANYKAQRHLLMKDYYPIFNPQRLTDYDGWQFHDPETGEGMVMAFRGQSPEATTTVRLGGLTPGRVYCLTDVDTGVTREFLGGTPLTITIPTQDGAAWYRYCVKTTRPGNGV